MNVHLSTPLSGERGGKNSAFPGFDSDPCVILERSEESRLPEPCAEKIGIDLNHRAAVLCVIPTGVCEVEGPGRSDAPFRFLRLSSFSQSPRPLSGEG